MESLAEQITRELGALVGQAIVDCWRAADMQVFEFGPTRRIQNREGQEVEAGQVSFHVQCPWRFVNADSVLFGSDGLRYPADQSISLDEFDWDKNTSLLDATQRAWFANRRRCLPKVTGVRGDPYGGFRIQLEDGVALECLPCDSQRGEDSEYWRLLGHRPDGSHFVVCGAGAELVPPEPAEH